ncbi:MAG: O-methyltransferase [Thermoproteota archaeon]|nr:O-methyltransferase [Thermoproteota archaeon]
MSDSKFAFQPVKILEMLSKLEARSELERSGKIDISHENSMLAVTADTGKFLSILISAMKCNRILEIGTSVGYSTLWMALALVQNQELLNSPNRSIITIENNSSKIKRAVKNFEEAGVKELIEIVEGNALNILTQLSTANETKTNTGNNLFDFVFLDADKEGLVSYFDLVLPLVRKGGVIVTDNILSPQDYRSSMIDYVNHVRSKQGIQSVTVPIGYGEEVSLKIM